MEKFTKKNEVDLKIKEGYESEEAAERAKLNQKNLFDIGTTFEYNVHLHNHMDRWAVYPLGSTPVTGNQCGYLAPKKYGGLTYKILGRTAYPDVHSIQTESFGKVNIYIPKDWDSCWTRTYDKTCPGGYIAHDPNKYIGN